MPARFAERFDRLLDRYRFVVLAILAATYFAMVGAAAIIKPFWHDEIYTILLANLPSASSIWRASLDGADLAPPLNTWLTHVVHSTAGGGQIMTRLPAILGFSTMAAVVMHMLRRRANMTVAVAGLVLPCFTAAYRYSYEARGYGLMLGLFALSLHAWAEAARAHRRAIYLPLLALTLAAGVWNHYYGAIAFAVIGAGELVRLVQNRRPDWGIWSAMGLALLSTMALIPLISGAAKQAGTFWSTPQALADVAATYRFLFQGMLNGIFGPAAVLIGFCLIAGRVKWLYPDAVESRRLPSHEVVAGLACLLIPVLCLLLGVLVTGVYVPRYALPTVVGAALAVPLTVWWLNPKAGPAEVVLAVVLAYTFMASATPLLRTRPVFHDPVKDRVGLLASLRSPGPTVVAGSLQFIQLWYYTPRELKGRMRYLLDPQAARHYRSSDTIDRGYAALGRWTALPVEPYDGFRRAHANFRVYSWGSGWLLDKLRDEGEMIERVSQDLHGGQLLNVTASDDHGKQ